MITFRQKGDFSKLDKYLKKAERGIDISILDQYGKAGVDALASATPKDTGLTSRSWTYTIDNKPGSISISFHNSNFNDGVPIAIILQYGHATRNGGWVEGVDYINPAIRPVFEELSEKAWKEVSTN